MESQPVDPDIEHAVQTKRHQYSNIKEDEI
jgi:hypothetical protein